MPTMRYGIVVELGSARILDPISRFRPQLPCLDFPQFVNPGEEPGLSQLLLTQVRRHWGDPSEFKVFRGSWTK